MMLNNTCPCHCCKQYGICECDYGNRAGSGCPSCQKCVKHCACPNAEMIAIPVTATGYDKVALLESALKEKDELIKELRAFIEKPVPTKHYSTKKEGHFSRNCSLCEYERERAALLEKSKPVEAILSASKGVEENQ